MTRPETILLRDIEAFLTEVGMGESYFGKAAVGNSELLKRLRAGKRVWPETEGKARSFMRERRDARLRGTDDEAAA